MGFPEENVNTIVEYEEKTVRDLMCPLENFSSISSETSVRNAVYIMRNSTVSPVGGEKCLLVFENRSLVGYVGVTELFASVQPHTLKEKWYRGWNLNDWAEPVFIGGLFNSLCLELSEKPLKDIMESFSLVIDINSTLAEAVFKMCTEKRDMIPVADKEKVVGIIKSADIFSEMADVMLR